MMMKIGVEQTKRLIKEDINVLIYWKRKCKCTARLLAQHLLFGTCSLQS